jgi:pyruvate,orthophosphate dikinase
VKFGAEGIGLFRTEHMFYGEGSEEPLFQLRKMIVSKTEKERREALNGLFKYVKKDVKDTLKVMNGRPVTVRLLDPPLHEFVPHDKEKLKQLGKELGISMGMLNRRARHCMKITRCWVTAVFVLVSVILKLQRCR